MSLMRLVSGEQSRASVLPVSGTHSRSRRALWYAASYLYGSLPVVYLLGRARGADLRATGSGTVGGANLWSVGGTGVSVLGWIFDASKGALPVIAGRSLGYAEADAALAGACGAAGQCWPVFLDFNGGRGISAWVGAGAAINRRAWACSLIPLISGALWRVASVSGPGSAPSGAALRRSRGKTVPLGCLLGVLVLPPSCALISEPGNASVRASLILAVIVLIRRLTAPEPDDALYGPLRCRAALLNRLLYDRNTSL